MIPMKKNKSLVKSSGKLSTVSQLKEKIKRDYNILLINESKDLRGHTFFPMLIPKIWSSAFKNVCILTTIVSTLEIKNYVERTKFDHLQYHFIDCTRWRTPMRNKKRYCMNIAAPSPLAELKKEIDREIEECRIDLLIFDDISPLFRFNKVVEIEDFLYWTMKKIKEKGIKGIYFVSPGLERKVIADVSLFVDAALTLR